MISTTVLILTLRAVSSDCTASFGNIAFAAAVADTFGLPRTSCLNCARNTSLSEWMCGPRLCLTPQPSKNPSGFKGIASSSVSSWCVLDLSLQGINGTINTTFLAELPAQLDSALLLDISNNFLDGFVGYSISSSSALQGIQVANNENVLGGGFSVFRSVPYLSLKNVAVAGSSVSSSDFDGVEVLITDQSSTLAAELFSSGGKMSLPAVRFVSSEASNISLTFNELLGIISALKSPVTAQWSLDNNSINGVLNVTSARNILEGISVTQNNISSVALDCRSSTSQTGGVTLDVSRNPLKLLQFENCNASGDIVKGVSSFAATEGLEPLAIAGIDARDLLAVFAASTIINFSHTPLPSSPSTTFVVSPHLFAASPCQPSHRQCRSVSFANCSLEGTLELVGGEDTDLGVVDMTFNRFKSIIEVCSTNSSTAFVMLDADECAMLSGCCSQSITPCQPCNPSPPTNDGPVSIHIYVTLFFVLAALALFVAVTIALYRRFAMKRFRTVPLLADDVVENAVSLTKTGRDRWTERDEEMLANDETVCSHFFAQYIWHPRKLGHGSFSDVFLVTRKKDGVKFALKRNKCADNATWDSLYMEYWLLHFAEHKNVVSIEEVFMLFADPFFLSAKEHVDQLSSTEFQVGDTTERFRDDLTRQTTQDDKFGPWLDDVPSEKRLADLSSSSGLKMSFTSSSFGRKEQARCCYIIMEYIPGGDLHSFIAARKSKQAMLTEVESLHIVVQIFDALRYLHEPARREALFARASTSAHHFSSGNFSRSTGVGSTGPILHGDIKPKNILLDMTGLRSKKESKLGGFEQVRAVLTDFGGAGTERYVAPEAIHRLIPPSDVFSAGCVAFELLCGNNASSIRSFHFACKQEKFAQKSREVLLGVGVRTETARFVTARLMAYDHSARPSAEEAYKTLLGFYKSSLK